MKSLISGACKAKNIKKLILTLQEGKNVQLEGVAGSFFSFLAAVIEQNIAKPLLIICDSPTQAEKITHDLKTFSDFENYHFPLREFYEDESTSLKDNLAERFFILERMPELDKGLVIVTPIKALLEKTISLKLFRNLSLKFEVGKQLDLETVIRQCVDLGYERCEMVEIRGEFSVRGGIIDIYPLSRENPVRIELLGDEIESIRNFDVQTQVSISAISKVNIVPAKEASYIQAGQDTALVLDYFCVPPLIIFSEFTELKKKAEQDFFSDAFSLYFKELKKCLAPYQQVFMSAFFQTKDNSLAETKIEIRNTLFANLEYAVLPVSERKEMVVAKIKSLLEKDLKLIITCNNEGERERLQEILNFKTKKLEFYLGSIEEGFFYEDLKLVVVSDQEIFARYKIKRSKRILSKGFAVTELSQIEEGDYVVHVSHGVGKFLGIQILEKDGEEKEFLVIEYDEKSKLYVPLEQISLVEKYIGLKGKAPKLNKLGSNAWQKHKHKVIKAVADLAAELLEIQAERRLRSRKSFSADTPWQYEFEKAFIYEETEDQVKAIEEIKKDMEHLKPMDRLICGDVGFGKTEVAMRASFKAVMDSKQVAVLVPTTVLALQHYKTFKDRLADYPINVEMLSRFRTDSQQRTILENLKQGTIDIIIGTHRLIQDDVAFKDLGLLIIDEEQRFGVIHKNKFKRLRKLVDVLTLTATPIPRTLYMSLTGIKDLSIINTPPQDRLPIETIVTEYNEDLIKKTVFRELERDGQVYFVHNRVESIEKMKETLIKLVPRAKVATAHGQMKEKELSEIMNLFILKKIDILVCTTIIESGIDIPNVNTIIINRADSFGLSDLYQLKGRVGRYKYRAYAYFLLPKDKVVLSIAKKRLRAIHDYKSLGAGLKVAMKDLEIRGAGNILGKDQHGHIYAIGFDLYCKLLKNSIEGLKGLPLKQHFEPRIKLPFSLQLPLSYIPSVRQRIEIYKKIYHIEKEEEISVLQAELKDRFGTFPAEMEAIFEKLLLKTLLLSLKITGLEIRNNHLVISKQGTKDIAELDKSFLLEENNPLRYIKSLRNHLKYLLK